MDTLKNSEINPQASGYTYSDSKSSNKPRFRNIALILILVIFIVVASVAILFNFNILPSNFRMLTYDSNTQKLLNYTKTKLDKPSYNSQLGQTVSNGLIYKLTDKQITIATQKGLQTFNIDKNTQISLLESAPNSNTLGLQKTYTAIQFAIEAKVNKFVSVFSDKNSLAKQIMYNPSNSFSL